MDQETHLNHVRAERAAAAFSDRLQNIPERWTRQKRIVRRLLQSDPLERLVPEKLLFEAVGAHLKQRAATTSPLVVLMNRSGHGDGARMANTLFPLLREHWKGVSLVHVSFSTPARGLGALVRGLLVKAGADFDVDVHVVAHNRPVEGLDLSTDAVDDLVGDADLVISFASGGGAGLVTENRMFEPDPLLSRSHIAVLSYPDPEGLVGELGTLGHMVGREPDLEALRLGVEVMTEPGRFESVGSATIEKEADAATELWPLIEAGRRRMYRVLLEPLLNGDPQGDPLVCPCRSLIQSSLAASLCVEKIVPAGSRLVAVARGTQTVA